MNDDDAFIYAENYMTIFDESDRDECWVFEDVRDAAQAGYNAGWHAAKDAL